MKRIPVVALLIAALPLLAGCSVGGFVGAASSPTPTPTPTKTFSTGQDATPSPGESGAPSGTTSGPLVAADGSVAVCNGLGVAKVAKITGLKLTGSAASDPDTAPGSGYTTYGCIYFGADPANLSVDLSVEAGDVNQAFQDNSDGIKPTFGWGPIEGVGDRAEGDGAHVLDVLWGSRYVIQVVDNTPDSDVGIKNMAALATALHEKLGD